MDTATPTDGYADTATVLADEQRWLRRPMAPEPAHPEPLTALCLSGGGIRSATFGLGVLQGLAARGVLQGVDYLSTVSGGGYIGSWWARWVQLKGRPATEAALAASAVAGTEADEVRRLRAYGSYLSPVWGLSTDLLTLVAIYLRNLLLHSLVVVPLLVAGLLLPWLYVAGLHWSAKEGPTGLVPGLWALCCGCGVWVVAHMVAHLPDTAGSRQIAPGYTPAQAQGKAGYRSRGQWVPLLVAAMGLSVLLRLPLPLPPMPYAVAAGVAVLVVGAVLGCVWRYARGLQVRSDGVTWVRRALVVGASGAVLGGGLQGLLGLRVSDHAGAAAAEMAAYATLTVPALLALFWLGATVYTGLASRWTLEVDREWWARAAAQALGVGLAWLALMGLVLWLPGWLLGLEALQANDLSGAVGTGAVLLGLVTTAVGFWSQHGDRIQRHAASVAQVTGTRLLELAALVSAVGVLLSLTGLIVLGLHLAQGGSTPVPQAPAAETVTLREQRSEVTTTTVAGAGANAGAASSAQAPVATTTTTRTWPEKAVKVPERTAWEAQARAVHSGLIEKVQAPTVGTALLAALVLAWVASLATGVNTFSLTAMYANRLTRAYLGSARGVAARRPLPFIGFDPEDDAPLAARAAAPGGRPLLHVLNAALNLTRADAAHLDWQQRKATSFTMSPLHCGSPGVGYVRTPQYGGPDGMRLGQAMTISGAAASPHMGYHSSRMVGFMMLLFNVRLGVWAPNPGLRFRHLWGRTEPRLGWSALLAEAGQGSSQHSAFIHLSDGGHFENLGLYEMVRRRCQRIVVVDAAADPAYEFDDLQNAIRRVRVDFGVAVELLGPLPQPGQGRHSTLGRIHYPAQVPGGEVPEAGWLVYIKPVLTGAEALDVQRYAALHRQPGRAFPQQPTSDQVFDEAQFESYRQLGVQSALQAFGNPGPWAEPWYATAPSDLAPVQAPLLAAPGESRRAERADSETEWVGAAAGAAGWMERPAWMLASALTVSGVVGVAGAVALSPSAEVALRPGSYVEVRLPPGPAASQPVGTEDVAALRALVSDLQSRLTAMDDALKGRLATPVLDALERLTTTMTALTTATDNIKAASDAHVTSAKANASATTNVASASLALSQLMVQLQLNQGLVLDALKKIDDKVATTQDLAVLRGRLEQLSQAHQQATQVLQQLINNTSPRSNVSGATGR